MQPLAVLRDDYGTDFARLLADEFAALGVKRPLLLYRGGGNADDDRTTSSGFCFCHRGLTGAPPPAARYFILRHELCHLERHDLAYKLLLTARRTLCPLFRPACLLVFCGQADEDVGLAWPTAEAIWEGMTQWKEPPTAKQRSAAVQAKIAPVPMTTSFGSTVAERLKRRLANVLGGKKGAGCGSGARRRGRGCFCAADRMAERHRCETKDVDVWPTMEDYALDRANAVREAALPCSRRRGGASPR